MRRRILDAAMEIFEEGGLAVLSMRAVAARAGGSPAGIYLHFDGKGEIIKHLRYEGFERLLERQRNLEAEHPAAVARLRQACRGFVRFALENPALYELMFSPPESLSELPVEEDCPSRRSYEMFRLLVEESLAEANRVETRTGSRTGSPERMPGAVTALFAAIHGLALLQLRPLPGMNRCNCTEEDRELQVEAAIGFLLDNLGEGVMPGPKGGVAV